MTWWRLFLLSPASFAPTAGAAKNNFLPQTFFLRIKECVVKKHNHLFSQEEKVMTRNIIYYIAVTAIAAGFVFTTFAVCSHAAGTIVSCEQDYKAFAPITATKKAAAPAVKEITSDQALDIALKHAGIAKKDALFPSVKKDYDDGRQVYEVEFYAGFMEYNYDIDVATGSIIEFDIDD